MAKLVIRDNKEHDEPDVFLDGVNICEMSGVLAVHFAILPGELPRLTIEMDAVDGIDIEVQVSDQLIRADD